MSAMARRRAILVLGVEGFGSRERTDLDRYRLRVTLYKILARALAGAGIDPHQWAVAGRGDQPLLLVDLRAAGASVIDRLILQLAADLHHHNRGAPEGTRMRLRVALHAGEAGAGPGGAAGEDVRFAYQLLNAEPLRRELREDPGLDLALILSDALAEELARHGAGAAGLAGCRQVHVQVQGREAVAWLRAPGGVHSCR